MSTPANAPSHANSGGGQSHAGAGIHKLWPVRILIRRFPQHAQVNPKLVTLFNEYRRAHPRNAGAVYASPDNFAADMEDESLNALKKFLLDSVFAVAADANAQHWKPRQSLDVKLTGMWFQITNDSAFHDVHVHGNCSWSGVYYVQAGDCSVARDDVRANGMLNGVTRFYGPQMEYLAGGHGDRGNYYLNDHTFDCFPQDGKLCVFPSHLKHMAFPYRGKRDRIIVSFHAVVDSEEELRYRYAFA